MKSRDFTLVLLALAIIVLSAAAFSHSRAYAQECGYDTKMNPIPCPEDQGGKKKKKTPIVYPSYTPTPTPTGTPKPTETRTPTATSTKPADCINCQNGLPGTGGGSGSPNQQAPGPDAQGVLPWLIGGGGILLGLMVGALAGAFMSRRRAQQISPAAQALYGEVPPITDDDSTLFIKLNGDSLERFYPRLSTANQLSKVEVRGYDPVHKKEIVGSAANTADLGGSSPHEKGGHTEEEGSDRVLKAVFETYEEEIHTKSAGEETHFKKKP